MFLTPVFDQFRKISKIPFIENFLVKQTQGKRISNFWVKLLPSIYAYTPGTIRKAKRNGINYELDISDFLQYVVYFGLNAEPKKLLYDSVKDGMYIFDIGTNIGEVLLNFAKINQTGKNFGFEPVPFLFDRAKKNISLNNFSNIYLNNIALSNREEKLFFSLPPNRNFGSITLTTSKNEGSREVQAMTFDNFIRLNNIPRVDFIKIDVEGFESNVLEGASLVIREFKPILFIELVDHHLRKNNSTASALVLNLSKLGYKIYDAETSTEVNHLMSFEGKHLDILCLPDKTTNI